MGHAHNNNMQKNICNAFYMQSGTWRCNDAIPTMFHLGDAGVDSLYWVYILLDL